MKTMVGALLVVCATVLLAQGAPDSATTYRFDDVRRSVMVSHQGAQTKAAKGAEAAGGDLVKTGWLSYALISSERYRARFEIYGSSDVELAKGTPGVVLSLNRGRIHAIFDKLLGAEPRVVQTPGALLAVRGTEFSVEVSAKGETTVDVFEGLVEVQSPLRAEPLLVRRGQSGTFSPRREPRIGETPQERRRDGKHEPFGPADRNAPPPRDGGMDRPRSGMPGGTGAPMPGGPSRPGGGMGGGGMPSGGSRPQG